jgi:hypothetical protein
MTDLEAMRAQELAGPVPDEVRALAATAAARHAPGARTVLFYGSCRREGWRPGALVDLYVLVDRYAGAHRRLAARLGNRVLPPNVYRIELPGGLHAKYAVVSLDQLERLVRPGTWNPYFWARLAQPVSLALAADEEVATRVAAILAQAARTAHAAAVRLAGPADGVEALWAGLLRATYATELRPERLGRAVEIVRREAGHFAALSEALAGTASASAWPRAVRLAWTGRRLQGRTLAVLRLTKAAFTFAGGPGYALAKIERHAGRPVRLTGWQRRHPLLAAPWLLLRLYRDGALR